MQILKIARNLASLSPEHFSLAVGMARELSGRRTGRKAGAGTKKGNGGNGGRTATAVAAATDEAEAPAPAQAARGRGRPVGSKNRQVATPVAGGKPKRSAKPHIVVADDDDEIEDPDAVVEDEDADDEDE